MFSERGSLLIQELIGIAIGTVNAALVALLAQYTVPLVHDQYVSFVRTLQIGELTNTITSQSQSAQAWFIPNKDVFGNSQPTSAGSPGATGMVAFPSSAAIEADVAIKQNVGTTGTYQFYAYRYNSSSKELEEISYYTRRADGTALCAAGTPCTQADATIVNSWPANACSFASLLASQIPSIDPFVAQLAIGKTIPDVALKMGFSPDVLSGNKLYAMQCDFTPSYWVTQPQAGNNYYQQQLQFVAEKPLSTTHITVGYSPPSIGGMSLSLNPNPIVLGYAGAQGLPSSGTIDASVVNYHHNIVVDGSTMSAVNQSADCSGIAKLTLSTLTRDPSGSPNSPPTSYPGTWMNFGIAPESVGVCDATFATESGLQPPDNVVQQATAQIIVKGQLSVSPSSLSFSSLSGSQNAVVSEPGYSGAFSITGNTCSSHATISGGGNGPSRTYSVSPVASTTNGPCAFTFSDSLGDSGTLTVSIASAPMKTWPIAVKYGASGMNLASTSGSRAFDVASVINAAFAGGIAGAASTCPAIAYRDAAMTQVDANNSTFQLLGVSTDAKGCYNGDMVAYEPGGTASSFSDSGSTCGTAVKLGVWSAQPSSASAITVVGGSPPVSQCTVTLNDRNNSGLDSPGNGIVIASVISDPCGIAGNVCMALQQFWSSESVQGGGQGIPVDTCTCTDTQDYSLWSDLYVSSDGGNSWSFLGTDLYSTQDVTKYRAGLVMSRDSKAMQKDTGPNCTTSGTYQHSLNGNTDQNIPVNGTCSGSTELSESTYKYDVYSDNPYLGTPNNGSHWQTSQPPSLSGATLPTSTQFYPPASF